MQKGRAMTSSMGLGEGQLGAQTDTVPRTLHRQTLQLPHITKGRSPPTATALLPPTSTALSVSFF
jgi:hypothetical protein